MTSVDRVPLTRARVVDAALAMVDDNGLAALSMRKLGNELGVEAMSLYNHVRNKDDLLDAVVAHLLDLVEIPDPSVVPWRRRIEVLSRSFRTVGLAHPEAFTLLVGRGIGDDKDAWAPLVAVYAPFRGVGLSVGESAKAFRALAGYVVGFVLMEGGVFKVNDGEPEARQISEPDTMLAEFVSAGDDIEQDELFESGLALFLDGLERRVGSAVADPDT